MRTPHGTTLADAVRGPGVEIVSVASGQLEISGLDAAAIGDAAARAGIVLHELTPVQTSLEDAYLQLTADDVEYHSGGMAHPTAQAAAPGELVGAGARPGNHTGRTYHTDHTHDMEGILR